VRAVGAEPTVDYVEELVPLGAEPLRIRRPRDFEALLVDEAFENEMLLPYWAELWQSGVALASEVYVRSLRGARTLELGCGLALPSIAAAKAGARVTATDWSPKAIELAAANAELNGATLRAEVQAWAEPDALVERAPWDLVLASDVIYDRGNVELLVELLPRLVDERGQIWVSDPGRPTEEEFLEGVDAAFDRRSNRSARQPKVRVHRLRKRAG
jgi:predicted nicotinamide N-methyase